jgi:hypothetical protein
MILWRPLFFRTLEDLCTQLVQDVGRELELSDEQRSELVWTVARRLAHDFPSWVEPRQMLWVRCLHDYLDLPKEDA